MKPPHTSHADLLCLSHLRWKFVFQRPQHLMARFARQRRVFFIEEPIRDAQSPRLELTLSHNVHVVVPHLPPEVDGDALLSMQRGLIDNLMHAYRIESPCLWFYTPLAWPVVARVEASAMVYDCMDELSGFAGAPVHMQQCERGLLSKVDLVFTGGQSLYEAKRELHPNVHAFPSSVDVPHFAKARACRMVPADQQPIARPRIGFCGVIDERMNLDLLREVAVARPAWQFVMIGPVVKIDPAALPQAPNLHYLGMKSYEELPSYFAGWDAAILPFAHNAATRFISPTKTPEYLAAGCPVVSTSIRDVVRPYGERGFVQIADTPAAFAAALEAAMGPAGRRSVTRADPFVRAMSWDRTWAAMDALLDHVDGRRARRRVLRQGDDDRPQVA